MRNYLNEARQRLEKIKYYDDHAGANGYDQALSHYSEFCALIKASNDSKHGKNDTQIIIQLKQIADELMKKMKGKKLS